MGHLESNILHFTCESLSEHVKTMNRYTTLAAQELAASKMKVPLWRVIVDPLWTFLKTYFFQRGFLDGRGRSDHRVHGGLLYISKILQSEKHELMRILHLDAGREMRGGQWQVLRLIEGLAARAWNRPCWRAMGRRYSQRRATGLARTADRPYARRDARTQARPHARARCSRPYLGRIVRGAPLLVSRRVVFPVGSRWKYGRARKYLAVSEFVKHVLMAGGVPEEKIAVVYDGVPVLEHAQGALILALSNAADPHKGAAIATEAAKLAGVTLQLSSELESDLRRASTFVYITHSEGLGSAVLLAMSAAVAVIASNTGGLPEIILHGENGLLVDNNPRPIADAMRQLIDDPAFARRRASRSQHRDGKIHGGPYGSPYHGNISPGDHLIEACLALLFGLLIGSFLNVCIYRWPRDLSVVRPRSHCIACDKTIAWYDNVPLLSYALLRGRCRYCGARISWRYPVVELATGLLFFSFVLALGPTLAALKMCIFSAMLVALVFSDFEERILPDEFTLGGTVVGLIIRRISCRFRILPRRHCYGWLALN